MKKTNEAEDKNKVIVKQNYAILNNIIKAKAQRHVKEENEPILDEIINNFNSSYAKIVASQSSIEILKFVRDEI